MKYLLFTIACVLLAVLSLHAIEPANSGAVILSPVIVIDRPISELRCSVRFRYHIPGAGMKDWVITKAPQWCAAKGLNVHDRITGIDGESIEGQDLVSFIKRHLVEKFGQPPSKPTHFLFEVQSENDKAPRKVEVVFDDSRNFTVAFP